MVEREGDFSAFDVVRKEYVEQVNNDSVSPQLKDIFHAIIHTEAPDWENWEDEEHNFQRLLATYFFNEKNYYVQCIRSREGEEEYAGLIEWFQDRISSIDEEMDALPAPFSDEELMDLY